MGLLQQVGNLQGSSGLTSLQYADDTLLLLPTDMLSIRNLKIILYCFELMSGLCINFKKSTIYPLGPPTSYTATAAHILHCKIGALPFIYLGIPIKAKSLNRAEWQPLIDRVERKLGSWQGPCLSRAGRLTLVNSVLTNTTLHYMSFLRLPQWVIKKIDQIRRAFLWKGANFVSGSHCLVRWEQVCSPKDHGGLGIIRLKEFNTSLLAKWWWRLLSNLNAPWVLLVKYNYYSSSRLWSLHLTNHARVSPFWRSVLQAADAFKLGLHFVYGNGAHILFWHDCWLVDQPLSRAFPSLFEIAADSEATVNSQRCANGTWAPIFRSILSPSRLASLRQLLALLQSLERSGQPDSFTWRLHRSGIFSTSSLYKALLPPSDTDFAARTIWAARVPPKIKMTMWLALFERLPTRVFLHRRNILPDSLCPFCSTYDETTAHFLLHCVFACEVWQQFQVAFHLLSWPRTIRLLWTNWRYMNIQPPNFQLWDATVMAVVWTIWMERNDRVFNNSSLSVEAVSSRVNYFVQLWMSTL